MNRYVALFILTAIALAGAARPAEAVIYAQTGPNGTFNAYQLITNDLTFDAARLNANNLFHLGHQGQLTSIHSAAENTVVNNVGFTSERWIGLTDSTATSTLSGNFNYASLGTAEGGNTSGQPLPPAGLEPVSGQRGFGWKWVDGSPLVFQSWNGGEPNNSGTENAAMMVGTAGLWNDNKAGASMANGADVLRDSVVKYNTQVQNEFNLQAWKATIVKVQDVQIPGVTVGNLTEARQVIAGTRPLPAGTPQLREPSFNGGNPLTQAVSTVNFVNNGTAGFFGGDAQYPGLGVAPFTGDQNNFVILATGSFTATASNTYTFGVNSDDGFALTIRDAGNNVVAFQDWSGQNNAASNDVNQTQIVNGELRFHNGRGHSNDANANNAGSYGRVNLDAGSQYSFELVHWEGTGGTASLEAFYMQGTPTDYAPNLQGAALSFNDGGGAYRLLGDSSGGLTFGQINATTHKLFNQVNFPDITNMAQADLALLGAFGAPTAAGFPKETYYSHININNAFGNPTPTRGHFGAANGFIEDPVFGLGTTDDFVLQATTFLHITQPGMYMFGVNSDDGSRLRIDVNGDGVFDNSDNIILVAASNQPHYANVLLDAGFYGVEFTWFERGGDAGAEVFAAFNPTGLAALAQNTNPLTVTNGLVFRLVGDTDNGGLRVLAEIPPIPEPATAILGLVGLAALARRRNRNLAA